MHHLYICVGVPHCTDSCAVTFSYIQSLVMCGGAAEGCSVLSWWDHHPWHPCTGRGRSTGFPPQCCQGSSGQGKSTKGLCCQDSKQIRVFAHISSSLDLSSAHEFTQLVSPNFPLLLTMVCKTAFLIKLFCDLYYSHNCECIRIDGLTFSVNSTGQLQHELPGRYLLYIVYITVHIMHVLLLQI